MVQAGLGLRLCLALPSNALYPRGQRRREEEKMQRNTTRRPLNPKQTEHFGQERTEFGGYAELFGVRLRISHLRDRAVPQGVRPLGRKVRLVSDVSL